MNIIILCRVERRQEIIVVTFRIRLKNHWDYAVVCCDEVYNIYYIYWYVSTTPRHELIHIYFYRCHIKLHKRNIAVATVNKMLITTITTAMRAMSQLWLTVDGAFVLDGFGLVGSGLVGDWGSDGGGYEHEGDQHLDWWRQIQKQQMWDNSIVKKWKKICYCGKTLTVNCMMTVIVVGNVYNIYD